MATGKKLSMIKKYSRSPKAYPSTTLVYNLGKAKHTEVPDYSFFIKFVFYALVSFIFLIAISAHVKC